MDDSRERRVVIDESEGSSLYKIERVIIDLLINIILERHHIPRVYNFIMNLKIELN